MGGRTISYLAMRLFLPPSNCFPKDRFGTASRVLPALYGGAAAEPKQARGGQPLRPLRS